MFAHRGARAHAPENTLEAFQGAGHPESADGEHLLEPFTDRTGRIRIRRVQLGGQAAGHLGLGAQVLLPIALLVDLWRERAGAGVSSRSVTEARHRPSTRPTADGTRP